MLKKRILYLLRYLLICQLIGIIGCSLIHHIKKRSQHEPEMTSDEYAGKSVSVEKNRAMREIGYKKYDKLKKEEQELVDRRVTLLRLEDTMSPEERDQYYNCIGNRSFSIAV